MADLTVLILSPAPIPGFSPSIMSAPNFVRNQRTPTNMVSRRPPVPILTTAHTSDSEHSPLPFRDDSFLLPPVNTWRSGERTRARPASAPPARLSFLREDDEDIDEDGQLHPDTPSSSSSIAHRVATRTKGGELIRPPPPLRALLAFQKISRLDFFFFLSVRPTTFWRKTRRSGVTGASYSPSSHLIRRSTFIAAGLSLESPVADLSALCVESRIGFLQLPPDEKLQ